MTRLKFKDITQLTHNLLSINSQNQTQDPLKNSLKSEGEKRITKQVQPSADFGLPAFSAPLALVVHGCKLQSENAPPLIVFSYSYSPFLFPSWFSLHPSWDPKGPGHNPGGSGVLLLSVAANYTSSPGSRVKWEILTSKQILGPGPKNILFAVLLLDCLGPECPSSPTSLAKSPLLRPDSQSTSSWKSLQAPFSLAHGPGPASTRFPLLQHRFLWDTRLGKREPGTTGCPYH